MERNIWVHIFGGMLIIMFGIGLVTSCDEQNQVIVPIHMGAEK